MGTGIETLTLRYDLWGGRPGEIAPLNLNWLQIDWLSGRQASQLVVYLDCQREGAPGNCFASKQLVSCLNVSSCTLRSKLCMNEQG